MSVAKVQVGLLGSARALQRDLDRITKGADTDSVKGLNHVLQGACVILSAFRKLCSLKDMCCRTHGCRRPTHCG